MAGNKLVIVESPTKAKKIAGYLGDGYTVMASVGHIRDLAQPSAIPAKDKEKYGKFGVDVNDGFIPYYVVGDDKKKTVAELKKALNNADELYLATDEDREGEAIAWHLVQTLKPKVPVKRMVFHEITKPAIQDALKHTRDVDDDMVDAQETRRILDRLYGYELSPVLWRKVGPGLSAGRVQSVATRLIVERERERMAFVRASYWDVTARVAQNSKDTPFDARLVMLDSRRVAGSRDFTDKGALTSAATEENVLLLDEAHATAIAQAVRDTKLTVTSVEHKPYTRRPAPPFTTSTLQQEAGNRLGMGARATMRAAQSLYENGYITYMRTDSVTLSGEALHAAHEAAVNEYGAQYVEDKPHQYATRTAGAQEAHEAIRPAGAHFRSPAELSALPADQAKLYALIWRRTIASQMKPATGSTATLRLTAATSEGDAVFQASGTVITFPGFLKVYGYDNHGHAPTHGENDENDTVLPDVKEGDALVALAAEPAGHETQPPARYTEASLVKELEKREIGRPSTYASIISTIMDRGYVYERGRALIPSWLAFAVINLLETKFPQYVDYAFTAQMENGLDRIAQGREKGRDWLTRFYFGTGEGAAGSADEVREGLHQQVEHMGDIDAHAVNTIDIGDGIAVRVGRYGPYVEDSKNRDATGKPRHASIPDTIAPDELTVAKARELLDSAADGPRVLGVDPVTGGEVTVRNGRYGPYVALTPPADVPASADAASDTAPATPDTPEKSAKTRAKKSASAAPKAKMASLFKTMQPETVTLEQALHLLSLPRTVGTVEETNPETGETSLSTIQATNGKYGPYLVKTRADGSTDSRSLNSEDDIFTVTTDQAQALFAQPRQRRGRGAGSAASKTPLRELGVDPESGKSVVIRDGRFGPYITDGVTNRTLPRQYSVESITAEDAYRILAEKRAAGPAKSSRTTRSRSTAKSGVKSASSKSTSSRSASRSATKSASRKTSSKSASQGVRRASSRTSTAKSSVRKSEKS